MEIRFVDNFEEEMKIWEFGQRPNSSELLSIAQKMNEFVSVLNEYNSNAVVPLFDCRCSEWTGKSKCFSISIDFDIFPINESESRKVLDR